MAGGPSPSGSVRLAPLPEEGRSPDVVELLSADGPYPIAAGSNWFATLAHNPGLFRKFAPFSSRLIFAGKLPARDREVLMLRTAFVCRARYEWVYHVRAGLEAGVSDKEIEQIAESLPALQSADLLLVQAADELLRDYELDDRTWRSLAERYSPAQLIEIPFLVGCYAMVAGAMRSFGVRLEADAADDPHAQDW